MANLTIAVDDALLKRARIRALELDTSVNALLRDYLESFAGAERMAPRRRILASAEAVQRDLGIGDRTWTRSDLHER